MSINRHAGALAAFGCLLLGSHSAHAQGALQEKLATVKRMKCVFPVQATGTWKDGVPQAEVKTAALSIRFDAIDADEGTARIVGDFGPSDIIVRLSYGTLHFVQVFSAGPLYTTTVFAKETRGGKLRAVHTRHEYTEVSLPGFTSRPEQYYGECDLEP